MKKILICIAFLLCAFHLPVSAEGLRENEIINIGSGYGYSVNDIIDRLRRCIDIPFDVVYKNSRSVDVNSMVLNISKLKSLIDVKHTHLEDGIKMFFEYVKQIINKK